MLVSLESFKFRIRTTGLAVIKYIYNYIRKRQARELVRMVAMLIMSRSSMTLRSSLEINGIILSP